MDPRGAENEAWLRQRITMKPPLGLHRDRLWEDRITVALESASKACFTGNKFACLASVDDGFLHVSLSHRKRYPTWNEIKAVREWLFPDEMEVVMVLARKSEYVSISENCFHLWQSACGEEGCR